MVLDTVAVLGDFDGPGLLQEGTAHVVRDARGRFWVGQPGTIKVFDSTGRFLRTVGREGAGPMEFRRPFPRFADHQGVHVYDDGHGRVTTIDSQFQLVTEERLPGPTRDVATLPGGAATVVHMLVHNPDLMGVPLHIVRNGDIVESFARPSDGWVDPVDLRLVVTTDEAGRIYSTAMYDYSIDIWNRQGERLGELIGPELNEQEVRPGRVSDDNPLPNNTILDLRVDDRRRLWVLRWVRRAEWRSEMREYALPGGEEQLVPRDTTVMGLRRMVSAALDVIDLATGEIVARSRVDPLVRAFVGDELALENRLDPLGAPEIVIVQIRWR